MSTNARPTQESNAGAQTSLIGIDAEGSEHRWVHQRRAVIVIRPGSAENSTYGVESIDAWAEKVHSQVGWDDLRYGESLTDTIGRALGADDA